MIHRRLVIIDDPLSDEIKLPRQALLDRPTPPNLFLDILMSDALTRLYLVADGGTASWERRPEKTARGDSGAKAHPSSIPSSSGARDWEKLRREFDLARTHRARLRLILEAQYAAVALAYAPDRSMVRGTREWEMSVAADPRSNRALARVYSSSHMTIQRIKKRHRPKDDDGSGTGVDLQATTEHTSHAA